MFVLFALLLGVLHLLGVAQYVIPPIPCVKHDDSASKRDYRPGTRLRPFALCETGICISMKPNASCENYGDCGENRSCRAGRCVFAGLGAACDVESSNCMPWFARDATSGLCVRGVWGVVCRIEDNCGFGHSCFFDMSYNGKSKTWRSGSCIELARRGVCRLGLEGSTECRRHMHCAGPLLCFHRRNKKIGGGDFGYQYICDRPVDLPSATLPKTFGKSVADFNCMNSFGFHGLVCVDGECLPRDLGQLCSKVHFCGTYLSCYKGRCVPAADGAQCISKFRGYDLLENCEPGT